MSTARSVWHRFGRPIQLVVVLLAVGLVVISIRALVGDPTYHVRLHHSAGIEAGDDVRVAGLKVGKVTAVTADLDQVDVAFTLDQAPDSVGVTTGSTVEVKLLSILGERFLALTPGDGAALRNGGTLGIGRALDAYTMDRFWLEGVPVVQDLDLKKIERAIGVLADDLKVAPRELRRSLDGITHVSEYVVGRQEHLDRLLSSTRDVTDLVLDQTDEIDRLLDGGTLVMAMVHDRQETLRTLLDEAHRFVTGLTAVVRAGAPQLRPALRDLEAVLAVFDEQSANLEKTLALAGPTMRVFSDGAGDGPWLGVNSPYAIFPDDLVCSLTPEECR